MKLLCFIVLFGYVNLAISLTLPCTFIPCSYCPNERFMKDCPGLCETCKEAKDAEKEDRDRSKEKSPETEKGWRNDGPNKKGRGGPTDAQLARSKADRAARLEKWRKAQEKGKTRERGGSGRPIAGGGGGGGGVRTKPTRVKVPKERRPGPEELSEEFRPKPTRRPATKRPKSKKNANKIFEDCCKFDERINPTCYKLCDYDGLNKQALINAYLTKSCPPESYGPVLECATGEKDHRPCCRNAGLGNFNGGKCLPFCYPKAGGLSMSPALLPCLDQLPKVVTCLRAGRVE